MNSSSLSVSLKYLQAIINQRFENTSMQSLPAYTSEIRFEDEASPFANFIQLHKPGQDEFVILLMAIAPHVKPNFYNQIIARHLPEGGDFPEFGGVRGNNHRGILPTGETAQFVLAGDDLKQRLKIQHILSSEHWFSKKHILWLEQVQQGEPLMSGKLVLENEVVELLTAGVISKPRFSINFPAEHIETEMDWDDLVLNPKTSNQIKEIEHWISHSKTLLDDG